MNTNLYVKKVVSSGTASIDRLTTRDSKNDSEIFPSPKQGGLVV